jgi:hypothetical protein
MYEKSYTNLLERKNKYVGLKALFHSLATKDESMQFVITVISLSLVLPLALQALANDTSKQKTTVSPSNHRSQRQGKAKANLKQRKPIKTAGTKTANPYSISRPYDPNNPPPISEKIHPVSSNAH